MTKICTVLHLFSWFEYLEFQFIKFRRKKIFILMFKRPVKTIVFHMFIMNPGHMRNTTKTLTIELAKTLGRMSFTKPIATTC